MPERGLQRPTGLTEDFAGKHIGSVVPTESGDDLELGSLAREFIELAKKRVAS
jgi:hypothetical protein